MQTVEITYLYNRERVHSETCSWTNMPYSIERKTACVKLCIHLQVKRASVYNNSAHFMLNYYTSSQTRGEAKFTNSNTNFLHTHTHVCLIISMY